MRPFRFLNRALPRGTARRRIFESVLFRLRPDHWAVAALAHQRDYTRYIAECEPALLAPSPAPLPIEPLISVVVPCFNTAQRYLDALTGSILGQTYRHLELVLVDASTDPRRSRAIAAATSGDERVVYERLAENGGISANTNRGLELARGDFVAFVDHDDVLPRQALYEVVRTIAEHPDADVVYSDNDKLDDAGRRRGDPFFKPDWSPAMLETLAYNGHLLVVRRSLVLQIGSLRSHTDGAQDYDLALRLSEVTDRIHHVPKVLYHWRMAKGSTARGIRAKPESGRAGRVALEEHLQRSGISAEVSSFPRQPAYYRVRLRPAHQPTVSLVLVTAAAQACDVAPLRIPASVELITVGPGQPPLPPPSSQHVAIGPLAGWAQACAAGRRVASGEVLVLAHADLEALEDGWIEELASVAARPGHGAVAPLLLDADGLLAGAGIVLSGEGPPLHAFRGRRPDELTPFGLATWPRNWLAVDGACFAIRASLFDEVAGSPDALVQGEGGDGGTGGGVGVGDGGEGPPAVGAEEAMIRWCRGAQERGERNLSWPYARLRHDEALPACPAPGTAPAAGRSGTAGVRNLDSGRHPALDDPYFNPNLDPSVARLRLRRCPAPPEPTNRP